MIGPVISYPTPAYQNPPIEPQYFQPSQYFISAISLGQTTTVTTTVNHNYVIGQQVRLIIPPDFGTRELNGQTGYVILIPSANQVTLSIPSVGFTSFIAATDATQPQIIAIGDLNFGFNQPSGTVGLGTSISGSFLNISPL